MQFLPGSGRIDTAIWMHYSAEEEARRQLHKQHPTRHQLYGHLPPITKTIQVKQTRHAGHCWRSKDKHSDVLLWTSTYGQAKQDDQPGCSPEDLSEVKNDREKWRERVRDIRASGTT